MIQGHENIRLEKFFIESESFSSKTLAYLQLKSPDERVQEYNVSQCQDKVGVYSSKRSLYIFSMMPFKPQQIGTQQDDARGKTQLGGNLENLIYEESKVTLHTKEYQFKDSMATQENVEGAA